MRRPATAPRAVRKTYPGRRTRRHTLGNSAGEGILRSARYSCSVPAGCRIRYSPAQNTGSPAPLARYYAEDFGVDQSNTNPLALRRGRAPETACARRVERYLDAAPWRFVLESVEAWPQTTPRERSPKFRKKSRRLTSYTSPLSGWVVVDRRLGSRHKPGQDFSRPLLERTCFPIRHRTFPAPRPVCSSWPCARTDRHCSAIT